MMVDTPWMVLCPGQGAQAVGMGISWEQGSASARSVFDEADSILGDRLGDSLRSILTNGPADRINRTDVAQPALFVAGVACFRALEAANDGLDLAGFAGLSLGEYTALHLAGAFSFADGLELVALRGQLMQEAAEASVGGMVALIGADEEQAEMLCANVLDDLDDDHVLVPANFNAPGQIVLSGHATACEKASARAAEFECRAAMLDVAGAFHSTLMQPAADGLAEALVDRHVSRLTCPVWSNVTGTMHDADDGDLLKRRLVEQVVAPVRWAPSCADMIATRGDAPTEWHELAPGGVLRGLMRRIDRAVKVTSHDEP